MNTTHAHKKLVAAALGAVVTGATASALRFSSAGTAHALQYVSTRGTVATIADLPMLPCASCVGFDPQPDPPRYHDRFNPSSGPNPAAGVNPPPGLKVGVADH
jgi:hypothetical protein